MEKKKMEKDPEEYMATHMPKICEKSREYASKSGRTSRTPIPLKTKVDAQKPDRSITPKRDGTGRFGNGKLVINPTKEQQ